jgi:hypothetical protein
MRESYFVVALAVVGGSLIHGGAFASCVDQAVIDRYVGATVTLRESVNHARVFYLNDPEHTYYHLTDPRTYLYGFNQSVVIHDIQSKLLGSSAMRRGALEDPSCTKITVEYSNELLGHQEMVVACLDDHPVSKGSLVRSLETAFALKTGPDDFEYYALNQDTNTLHSALCDHLPHDGVTRFKSIPAVEGLRLCGACFQEPQAIPDLDLELHLGEMARNNYLEYNITLQDPTIQEHVAAIGEDVLKRWPLPLRGYDHRFVVMDSRSPAAFAAPGGTVFICKGLLDALEDESELKAVLAHEIAHVEFRHGLRQFRSAQKAELISGIAAAVVGGVVGSATDDVDAGVIAAATTGAIGQLFSEGSSWNRVGSF